MPHRQPISLSTTLFNAYYDGMDPVFGTGGEDALRLYDDLQQMQARRLHGEDGNKLIDEFFGKWVGTDAPSGLEE